LSDWPDVSWSPSAESLRVNLDSISKADIKAWQPGQTLLLSGKLLTGRDAAHKRLATMLQKGEKLPIDFTNRFIYYVGPVDAVREEAVGPAGPTTATRMDDYTEMMLGECGLLGMVGKAERGEETIVGIAKHQSVYLTAVGGAAYLVSKAIKKAEVIAFADLGMEAIYEFTVQDMPVTVAVDSRGQSIHTTGPAEWKLKIAQDKTIAIHAAS
jgi:fumarate hydratase class I